MVIFPSIFLPVVSIVMRLGEAQLSGNSCTWSSGQPRCWDPGTSGQPPLGETQAGQPRGGDTVSRGSREPLSPPFPEYVLPDGPRSWDSIMPHSEGARSHFLPIFTDNLGELLDCHFIGSIILQVHVVDSSSGFC